MDHRFSGFLMPGLFQIEFIRLRYRLMMFPGKTQSGPTAKIIKKKAGKISLLLPILLFISCGALYEKTIMYHIYSTMDHEIGDAVNGTSVDPAYLAALISLESQPPGNRGSKRFESSVYERLLQLKHDGRPFGGIPRSQVIEIEDNRLEEYASSYGLTQIMGYHCFDLGCSIEQLRGPDHLKWAVEWMKIHYGKQTDQQDWAACFRIHNTGHPRGTTSRRDYVVRGLERMKNYRILQRSGGDFRSLLFEDNGILSP